MDAVKTAHGSRGRPGAGAGSVPRRVGLYGEALLWLFWLTVRKVPWGFGRERGGRAADGT